MAKLEYTKDELRFTDVRHGIMEKVAYTKDELKFIDNCANCLSTTNVFDSNVGHILTIDSCKTGISEQACKDCLFKLNLDEFDTIKREYNKLVIESIKIQHMYLHLINMGDRLRNKNEDF